MTSRDVGSSKWEDDGPLNEAGLALILEHFGLEDDHLTLEEVRNMSPSALQARRLQRERANPLLEELVAISHQPGNHIEAWRVG